MVAKSFINPPPGAKCAKKLEDAMTDKAFRCRTESGFSFSNVNASPDTTQIASICQSTNCRVLFDALRAASPGECVTWSGWYLYADLMNPVLKQCPAFNAPAVTGEAPFNGNAPTTAATPSPPSPASPASTPSPASPPSSPSSTPSPPSSPSTPSPPAATGEAPFNGNGSATTAPPSPSSWPSTVTTVPGATAWPVVATPPTAPASTTVSPDSQLIDTGAKLVDKALTRGTIIAIISASVFVLSIVVALVKFLYKRRERKKNEELEAIAGAQRRSTGQSEARAKQRSTENAKQRTTENAARRTEKATDYYDRYDNYRGYFDDSE